MVELVLLLLMDEDLFSAFLIFHLVEEVLDDSAGHNEQGKKNEAGKKKHLVSLDHSLPLILVLIHNVPRKHRS